MEGGGEEGRDGEIGRVGGRCKEGGRKWGNERSEEWGKRGREEVRNGERAGGKWGKG